MVPDFDVLLLIYLHDGRIPTCLARQIQALPVGI